MTDAETIANRLLRVRYSLIDENQYEDADVVLEAINWIIDTARSLAERQLNSTQPNAGSNPAERTTTQCQHDLLAPNPTMEVKSPATAYCTSCRSWFYTMIPPQQEAQG